MPVFLPKKRQKKTEAWRVLLVFLVFLQNFYPVLPVFAQEIGTSSAEVVKNATASAELPPGIEITLRPTPTPTEPAITPKTLKPTLSASNFEANETVDILLRDYYAEDLDVEVKGLGGEELPVEKETKEGVLRLSTGNTNLKPGKFFVTITTKEGEKILESEFLWGVLAINTEKSIYLPGEKASLAMAVLDEEGSMVCDADLKLFITSPEGKETVLSTKDGSITVNPECFVHDYAYKPDYEAFYQTESIGAYDLRLLAETKNGEFEIKDSFEVRQSVRFDVARDSATRVYPPKKYPVTFYITANEDFEGIVEETVPYDFEIFPAENNQSYDSVEIRESGNNPSKIRFPFEGEYEQSFGFGELSVSEEINEKMQSFGIIGHDGIDYALPEGTEVLAVDSGEVIKAEWADYGNTVIIEHEWGRSYYGHLSEFKVEKGQKVAKGELIALSGSTGFVTRPHLHFSLRPKGADFENGYFGKVDPQIFLASTGESNVLGMSLGIKVKVISWNVSVKKGEKFSLGYWFDSPDISPQFYLLGPLTFKSQTPSPNNQINSNEQNSNVQNLETVFQETRKWQIANDSTAVVRPDGDSALLQWTSTGSGHYTEIDEVVTQPAAGTTSDYVHNNNTVANVDRYTMGTITGVSSVSGISVWIYGHCTKNNSNLSVDLYYDGIVQHYGSVALGTSYGWQNTDFLGLNLTQSQLDGLEILITGDNGGRTYSVATLYADVTYTAATTTLGDGTDPGNTTVAPGGSATDLDAFTFTTDTGTDTITAVTATLNSYTGIGQADITDSSNVAQCTAITDPSSTTLNFTGCNLSVGTTATTYKIRITPKAHGDMPAVPGGEYAITGTVTSWTGSNTTHAGTDTDSATVTVDNLSPNNATLTSGSAGDAQVTINWTTSSSVDFSRSVVLRWTAGSPGAEVPVEGQDYTAGNTISTATVACVRTGDSSSTSVNCTDSSVSNGTTYSYKIFQKDSNGNYDAGVTVSGSPFTPSLSGITVSGVIYSDEGLSTYDCSVNNLTVSVRVGGSGSYSGICTGVGGSFSISNVTIGSAGDVVTVFIDGETEKAVTVARASNTTSDISTSLYQNRILLTHEDSGPVTNANLQTCDSGCDSDIQFTVTGGVLSVNSGNKIVVAPGKTYTPGGNMTVPSIGVGGTFNPESNTVSLTGSGIGTTCTDAPGTVMPLCVNGGTFNASNSTINYVAPAATTIAAATYFNLGVGTSAEAGAGATYTLGGNVNVGGTFTVGNASSANSDTLGLSSHTLTLTGAGTPLNITSKGALVSGTSTVEFIGISTTTISAASYNILNIKPGDDSVTHNLGAGTFSVGTGVSIGNGTNTNVIVNANANSTVLDIDGSFTINSNTTFQAHASNSFTIAGDFTNNGTFTANSGTVTFDDSAKTSNIWYGGVGSTQPFHNLTIATAGKQMKFDETEMTGIGGTFNVQGTNCTTGRVFLDSTTDGNQWDINVTGSADIDYADVEDSNAIVALAADNSTEDNAGNTNWTINAGSCSGNQSPSAPQTPHVNNDNAQTGQTSPVYGLIDHTPAFSAVFDDPDTSDTAVYYQLQVGTDTDWGTAEMWDSTKTSITACNEGSRCEDIIYNGSALADNTTYYWRIKFWDNSDAEGAWSSNQEFSMNDEPTVLSIVLNGGQNIQPIEGTTVGVGWTASVTDPGGYEEISTVVGKLYRSGVSGAEACSEDNNNCYSDASCSLTDCSGNTCTATCSVDVFFHADPTDVGSTYESQYWRAWIKATDVYTETGENYSGVDAVDLNSLVALSIDESIYYGSLLPGDSTSNKQTIITNTGNFDLDMMVSGYDMCTDYPTCTGYMITVANQQYSLNTFTFGDGVSLSDTETRVQVNLSKPTTSPSDSAGILYWGISIPDIKETGSYTGRNDILATADDGS